MARVRLDGLRGQLNDQRIRAALTGVGEYLLLETDNCFRDERAPDGTPWPPLKLQAKTLFRRRFGRTPGFKQEAVYRKRRKILTDTGRLRGSIAYRVSGNQVAVGTNVIYARTHNQGDPARGIPKREFLGLTPERERRIVELIRRELLG